MSEDSEWYAEMREQRNIQHAEWLDRVGPVVAHKLEKLAEKGHTIKRLTEWQIRIDGRYDIFWQSKRYHDIKENKRGDYFDLISFIESKTYATEPRHAPRSVDGRHHGGQ